MNKDTLFYRVRREQSSLNKRGYHYKNWNTDNSAPHAETFEALYKSIPFLIALEKEMLMEYSLIIILKLILIWERKIATIITFQQ